MSSSISIFLYWVAYRCAKTMLAADGAVYLMWVCFSIPVSFHKALISKEGSCWYHLKSLMLPDRTYRYKIELSITRFFYQCKPSTLTITSCEGSCGNRSEERHGVTESFCRCHFQLSYHWKNQYPYWASKCYRNGTINGSVSLLYSWELWINNDDYLRMIYSRRQQLYYMEKLKVTW